jgi:hypothetical protein
MIDTNTLGRLSGKSVVGPDGDSIGKIKDVYEATDGGHHRPVRRRCQLLPAGCR